jgi:hypothetical protein
MKDPNDEFSAWDDAKFSIGGLLVLASPVIALVLLLYLLF